MPHEAPTLASERTDETVWMREGRAMLNAGLEMQRIALTLPAESLTRQDLLASAKRWFALARGRGATR